MARKHLLPVLLLALLLAACSSRMPQRVVDFAPGDDAEGVSVETDVTARFARSLSPSDGFAGMIRLSTGATVVSGTSSYDPETATLTFDPAEPLAPSTLYAVEVVPQAERDAASAHVLAQWRFTTDVAGVDAGGSEVVDPTDTDGDGTPDEDDAFPSDPNETTDSDGDGVGDNADAFPNDPNEWADSDGDGVGDNADAFPNDPNEAADGDGDGVGDASDNCPEMSNPDQADTDGDGIGDACAAEPDTVAPTILERSPDIDATGVPTTSTVQVRFDEAMDPATLTTQTFKLNRGEHGEVTVSYDEDTFTATLTLNSGKLEANTAYKVILDASITDVAGNPINGTLSWWFTTGE